MQNKYMKNLIALGIVFRIIFLGALSASADYIPPVITNYGVGVNNGNTIPTYTNGPTYGTNTYTNTTYGNTVYGQPLTYGYANGPVITSNGAVLTGGATNTYGYGTPNQYAYGTPTNTYVYQQPIVYGPPIGPTPPVILSTGVHQVVSQTAATNSTPTTTTNTITKPTSVSSQFSTLGATNGFEGICPGQELNYTLTYQNTDKTKTLTNTVLRVTIPQEIVFDSASTGDYSDRDGTLTVFIGTLAPLQTGVVYIKAVAGAGVYGKELITTRTELSFTLPDGTQDTAVSYVFNNGLNCARSSLGALALFSGGFFPDTFWGWVVLIIVICSIIYFARKFYEKPHTQNAHAH